MAATGRVDDDELAAFLVRGVEGLEESAEREATRVGSGAYGYVFKIKVNGVERIAKKVHGNLVNKVSAREKKSVTSKFRAESIILSKLRHPNIVQFVGVHYGRGGMTDLTLFMECLSSDMDDFLSTHPNLPLPLKLSLLQDVSFGLVYLHECEPPIVHRDLTARNILVSDRCQAKIADLGMSKIVDIQAQLSSSHTRTPGQQYYMPPEALKENASCTPKLDIFSFGHLALYTVTQKLPEVYDITESLTMRMKEEGTIQRERRKTSISEVGEGHCLYPIITECLFDNPDQRPTTRDLNSRLCLLAAQNPEPESENSERLKDKVAELNAKIKELTKTVKLKDDAFVGCHKQIAQQKGEILSLQEYKKEQAHLMGRLKQELEEARSELQKGADGLKAKVQQLESELRTVKKRSLLLSSTRDASQTPQLGDCTNPKCTTVRSKLHSLELEHEKGKLRVSQLESIVEDMKEQIRVLEISKNEAVGDMAAARAEAEIYKADFLEERRDRERAQQLVTELKGNRDGQGLAFQEEIAELYKQSSVARGDLSKLKAEHARSEAVLEEQVQASRNVVETLTKLVEKFGNESESFKFEIEQMKLQKTRDDEKMKQEQDRLKQEFQEATRGNVRLVEQLEEVRKEKRELEKQLKKLQKKKVNKNKAKTPAGEPKDEQLSEEAEARIARLKEDITHYQWIVATLSVGIRDGSALFSQTDQHELQSNQSHKDSDPQKEEPDPLTDQEPRTRLKDSEPLAEPDPQPEFGIREHLDRLRRAKQMSHPLRARRHEPAEETRKRAMTDVPFQIGCGQLPKSRSGNHAQALTNSDNSHPSLSSQDSSQSEPSVSSQRIQPPLFTRQSSHELPLRAGNPPLLRARNLSLERPLRAKDPSFEPPLRARDSTTFPLRAGAREPSFQLPLRAKEHTYDQIPFTERVHSSADLPASSPSSEPMLSPEPPLMAGNFPPGPPLGHSREVQPSRASSEPELILKATDGLFDQVPLRAGGQPPVKEGEYSSRAPLKAGAQPFAVFSETPLRAGGNSSKPTLRAGEHPPLYSSEILLRAGVFSSKLPWRAGGNLSEQGGPPLRPGREELYCELPTLLPSPELPLTTEPQSRAGDSLSDNKNVILDSLDSDIRNMVAEVRKEVSEENECVMTIQNRPYDPNLVCPMCRKRHRIGEIQKFRQHVSVCDRELKN